MVGVAAPRVPDIQRALRIIPNIESVVAASQHDTDRPWPSGHQLVVVFVQEPHSPAADKAGQRCGHGTEIQHHAVALVPDSVETVVIGELEGVDAPAAAEDIETGAAGQQVVTVPADQIVFTGPAVEEISTFGADQLVIAVPAPERAAGAAGHQGVVTAAAAHLHGHVI